MVMAAMCTPARGKVLTALKPYGFTEGHNLGLNAYSLSQSGKRGQDGNLASLAADDLTIGNVVEVTVRPQAAAWAEYLLCRTRQFQLLSTPLEPRNEQWAIKHDGMPKPWKEKGCSLKQPPLGKRTQRPQQAKPLERSRPKRRDSILDFFRRF
jgi:hypothetical protein